MLHLQGLLYHKMKTKSKQLLTLGTDCVRKFAIGSWMKGHATPHKCSKQKKKQENLHLCVNQQLFTFESNDAKTRPSTSSSSGCVPWVNNGRRASSGELVEPFHSPSFEFPQRLFTLFLFLQHLGDDPAKDASGVELAVGVDSATGVPPATLMGWAPLISTQSFSFSSTRTSSPRAWLPLIHCTYSSFVLDLVDIMGFRTSLVWLSVVTGSTWSFWWLNKNRRKERLIKMRTTAVL